VGAAQQSAGARRDVQGHDLLELAAAAAADPRGARGGRVGGLGRFVAERDLALYRLFLAPRRVLFLHALQLLAERRLDPRPVAGSATAALAAAPGAAEEVDRRQQQHAGNDDPGTQDPDV